jgi:hypothetical protein
VLLLFNRTKPISQSLLKNALILCSLFGIQTQSTSRLQKPQRIDFVDATLHCLYILAWSSPTAFGSVKGSSVMFHRDVSCNVFIVQ